MPVTGVEHESAGDGQSSPHGVDFPPCRQGVWVRERAAPPDRDRLTAGPPVTRSGGSLAFPLLASKTSRTSQRKSATASHIASAGSSATRTCTLADRQAVVIVLVLHQATMRSNVPSMTKDDTCLFGEACIRRRRSIMRSDG